jgi:hypothetical protein
MPTLEEIRAADRRAKLAVAGYPKAVSAAFDQKSGHIAVLFNNGHGLLIDPKRTVGLRSATSRDLQTITITGPGLGLHFPKIDVDLYVPSLIEAQFLSKALAASKLGASGGKAKSRVKAAAARVNGMKGGRPKKRVAAKKKHA